MSHNWKLIDFTLKDNLALVDILPLKESMEILNEMVNLDREGELTTGLTVPQSGADYQFVKVTAITDQNMEIEGAKNQLIVEVGRYYLVPANRISYIGGINTSIPQAFVNTQDLLVELDIKEEEEE